MSVKLRSSSTHSRFSHSQDANRDIFKPDCLTATRPTPPGALVPPGKPITIMSDRHEFHATRDGDLRLRRSSWENSRPAYCLLRDELDAWSRRVLDCDASRPPCGEEVDDLDRNGPDHAGRAPAQARVCPPSMTRFCPVMWRAASETRKATAAAWSSGVARCPRGIPIRYFSRLPRSIASRIASGSS